ncbi:MAG TPA: lysylphosphatidylglycerol synthase transmembrane domain-containing protein [Thermomicrobiales bacterium]|nr:lysylphosphatidylglycerol synthase transmembrane domain-containing protein [Thermomicrobiales bacterium]
MSCFRWQAVCSSDIFPSPRNRKGTPLNLSLAHTGRRLLGRYGAWIWLALVLGATVWFGWRQQVEIRNIWHSLRTADPTWIAALVGIEIVILALITITYRSLLLRLGHEVRFSSLINVHLERIVVGTVTPVGGPSSMAIFVHRLRQRGVKPADALLTVSIKSVIGNFAFLLLLVPVLFVQKPSTLLLLSTGALILLVISMAWLLHTALSRKKPPRWIISRLPRKALRFLAEVRSHQISLGSLIGPFFYMLATKLGGVAMLFIALKAVGHAPNIQVPLMAYVVGMVFLLVAPVFQGIGVVEVSMAVALQQMGVPTAAAVSAVLLTRVGELWLPLLTGVLVQLGEILAAHRHPRPEPQPVPMKVRAR